MVAPLPLFAPPQRFFLSTTYHSLRIAVTPRGLPQADIARLGFSCFRPPLYGQSASLLREGRRAVRSLALARNGRIAARRNPQPLCLRSPYHPSPADRWRSHSAQRGIPLSIPSTHTSVPRSGPPASPSASAPRIQSPPPTTAPLPSPQTPLGHSATSPSTTTAALLSHPAPATTQSLIPAPAAGSPVET